MSSAQPPRRYRLMHKSTRVDIRVAARFRSTSTQVVRLTNRGSKPVPVRIQFRQDVAVSVPVERDFGWWSDS